MRSYGIMQGRLTPSNGRGIQFFPFDNWQQEFITGSSIGLNEIEWIFDYDRYEENPLWSGNGIRTLKQIIGQTGVVVNSVCFDYFMRRPFYKKDLSEQLEVRNENVEFISRVIDAMAEVGASLLEIPMVDDSSISSDDERARMIGFLQEVLDLSEGYGLIIGCETDMPVGIFRHFLDDVCSDRIKANYDSGNSSGLGYDHSEELHSLGEYVANVHIKDRVLHGTTVELGTGSAEFNKVFSSLKDIGYNGSIILQAARGEEGCETDNICSQLGFVREYCHKYGLD